MTFLKVCVRKRERDSVGILPFLPHEKWKCLLFHPLNIIQKCLLFCPLQKKSIKVLRKFKLPHHPQPPNLCVCIKFLKGLLKGAIEGQKTQKIHSCNNHARWKRQHPQWPRPTMLFTYMYACLCMYLYMCKTKE